MAESSQNELDSFLRAAKDRGASDEFLVNLLKQQGWPERTIYQALGRHYAEATGLPLPEARSNLESAREAFYHLLAFGTLGTWVFAIGWIWFALIDSWLPDPGFASYRYWSMRNMSWQIAGILVSFPVFVFATRSILRDMAETPGKAASWVRRWLTNLALLITALVFIGDLMGLLAVFLQGELSSRFVLKSLVVLALAGGVFWYYTRGLNRKDAAPDVCWHKRFALVSGSLIAVTLAFGFGKTGSPETQRLLAQDDKVLREIMDASYEVQRLYQAANPNALPNELRSKPKIEYRRGEGQSYQLCASFALASPVDLNEEETFWRHPAGQHCFAFEADVSPPPLRYRY
jgi:hypothetical protein